MQTGMESGMWDLSRSIRAYEFTRRAEANLKRIMDSGEFREKDAERIFSYLRDQMEIVSFGDFLQTIVQWTVHYSQRMERR